MCHVSMDFQSIPGWVDERNENGHGKNGCAISRGEEREEWRLSVLLNENEGRMDRYVRSLWMG